MTPLKTWIHAIGAAVLTLASATNALAADPFPSKPIRIVVPKPPGGWAVSIPAWWQGRCSSGMIREGRLRSLGVSSSSRLPSAPDIPTLAEQGFPGFSYYFWSGLLVPPGVPKEVLDKLSDALRYAGTSEEITQRFRNDGNEAFGLSPAQLSEYLAKEHAEMGRLARELKLPKQ